MEELNILFAFLQKVSFEDTLMSVCYCKQACSLDQQDRKHWMPQQNGLKTVKLALAGYAAV